MLRELRLPTTLRALLLAVSLLPLAGACARSGHDAPHNQVTMATGASAVTANAPEESFSIFEFDSAWKDQHGRDVRIQDVSGTATVVALIYTSCTQTCPLIIGALKRVESALGERKQDVRFLLVSIDPDRDTPNRLAEWAKSIRLDESRWTLLAGSSADIRQLAVTLDVRYQTQQDGEIAHTNGFSIINRDGQVVHVQTGYSDVEQAVAAVRALLR